MDVETDTSRDWAQDVHTETPLRLSLISHPWKMVGHPRVVGYPNVVESCDMSIVFIKCCLARTYNDWQQLTVLGRMLPQYMALSVSLSKENFRPLLSKVLINIRSTNVLW